MQLAKKIQYFEHWVSLTRILHANRIQDDPPQGKPAKLSLIKNEHFWAVEKIFLQTLPEHTLNYISFLRLSFTLGNFKVNMR